VVAGEIYEQEISYGEWGDLPSKNFANARQTRGTEVEKIQPMYNVLHFYSED
jgi:hypothetical protein